MGWTFKFHGGIAIALSAVLLMLGALTWLPGTLPLTGSKWPVVVIFALLFPIFISALLRTIPAGADRHSMWLAFRCLPAKVQLAFAALAMSGVVLIIFSMAGERGLQSAEVRDGRYFASDTAPHARGTVEISQSQYQRIIEDDQRSMFAIPGLLSLGAAYFVLAAGEMRRADRAYTPSF